MLSVQTIDSLGNIGTYLHKDIKFFYRGTNLPNDVIILSGTFKGSLSDNNIMEKINELKLKKDSAQPSKIKTVEVLLKIQLVLLIKVWQLIKEHVPLDTRFGDAEISKKHCNFFVNSNNAKFIDMMNLINYVKKKVKDNTNIDIELEIKIID